MFAECLFFQGDGARVGHLPGNFPGPIDLMGHIEDFEFYEPRRVPLKHNAFPRVDPVNLWCRVQRTDHQVGYPRLGIDIEGQARQVAFTAATRPADIPCMQVGARKVELLSASLQRLVDNPGLTGLRVRTQVENELAFLFIILFIIRNAFYNLDRTHQLEHVLCAWFKDGNLKVCGV